MGESVKPRRRYRSRLREQQAARTRETVLDAAASVLERDGFTAATLRGIADAAHVSVETVYAIFGSKAGLLVAVGERNFGGAIERAAPGGDLQAVVGEADLDAQLTTFGELGSEIMGPNWAVLDALRAGGQSDPELAEAYRVGSDGRRYWMHAIAETWAASGRLRAGMDVEQATDILWTITASDVYRLLVVEAGWPAARYAAWLSQAARDLVLG